MIGASEIEHMTIAERLQAMELLWTSLAKNPESVESPAWHEAVLSQRMAMIDSGTAQYLTVAELKERLKRRQP